MTSGGGALLRSDPIRVAFSQTRAGEVSETRRILVTNTTDDLLELVDTITHGPGGTAFQLVGIDATLLDPGEGTHLHLVFQPSEVKTYRGTCTIETDRGMGLSIPLIGRGKASLAEGIAAHDPEARDEQDAKDHAAAKDAHARAAHRGEIDVEPTYASMLAAFELAIEESERGNQERALALATAVRDRLAEVASEGRVVAVLRRHNVGLHAPLSELGFAKGAAAKLSAMVGSGWAVHGGQGPHLLQSFQVGRVPIELVTGESNDASSYAAFDRASLLTTGLVSALPLAVGAVAALPEVATALIARATPILIAEGTTFWFATKELFAWGSNYVSANPQAALAWTEFLAPLLIEGGENWNQRDQFVERLQTRDGFLSVLMQMMIGLAEVRMVTGGGTKGATASDGPAAPAGARPRGSAAGDSDSARTGPTAPRRPTDAAAESPDLTGQATRLVHDGLDEMTTLANAIRATRDGVAVPGTWIASSGSLPTKGDRPGRRDVIKGWGGTCLPS